MDFWCLVLYTNGSVRENRRRRKLLALVPVEMPRPSCRIAMWLRTVGELFGSFGSSAGMRAQVFISNWCQKLKGGLSTDQQNMLIVRQQIHLSDLMVVGQIKTRVSERSRSTGSIWSVLTNYLCATWNLQQRQPRTPLPAPQTSHFAGRDNGSLSHFDFPSQSVSSGSSSASNLQPFPEANKKVVLILAKTQHVFRHFHRALKAVWAEGGTHVGYISKKGS